MTSPTREIQSLDPSAIIELFVLDATGITGGGITRFHAGTNQLGTSVIWQGNAYLPFPVQATGFEITGKGTIPRPQMAVANVDGTVGLLVRDLQDLVGAIVTRKRTLAKFLDAVNFTGGVNPTADPTIYFPDDIYLVERKVSEDKNYISFELSSAFDVFGVKLPRRLIQATICPWVYKGTECGYAGALATCNKTLNDATGDGGCKQHFGATADLPFGGFPASATIR